MAAVETEGNQNPLDALTIPEVIHLLEQNPESWLPANDVISLLSRDKNDRQELIGMLSEMREEIDVLNVDKAELLEKLHTLSDRQIHPANNQ